MSIEAPSMEDRPFAMPPVRRIVIELAGEPKGKGRPRFGNGRTYTPQPTRNYEAALRFAAQAKMQGAALMEGPLRIEVLAAFSVPKSWSNKKQAAAHAGTVRPTGKPDIDNVLKTLDAFNSVVWRDDAQIVHATITKRYSDRPRLRIEVEQMFGEGA